MATLERLTVFPVKGLDGIDLDSTSVLDGGTLRYDREFVLVDTDGDVINGKRTDRVHELETDFDPAARKMTVETADGDERRFDLESERERVEEWFSDYFGTELVLERDESLGFVDRREMGPSLISTATLRTVASWFDEMTVEGARRRMRANVEVSGVPPFWEDRFVGDGAPALEVGDSRFEGVKPCGRCIVPRRDPDTGESIQEFRTRFVRNRREQFPEWADEDAFEHYYALMIITRVPEVDRGKPLHVGDPVEAIE
ncbi:MOSC domain-containing protein [Natrialba taiwanensis]|uniref:MOSC domain containing protein n=1 Tax=Natrialba taiwanensis DSM 12281 TaxID=1230458 RepID=M0ACC0_9EURY|nr:MOSC N-terminal beta barrel domain-containing protein [Natrialba taiwanensis]ELY96415.1 MOSC domain containing protein [Natrialba taiwanensis DSM 12281]